MASTRENTPHDESYKLLFSHQEMVESLIRDFVPEEWVSHLDFSTLEKQNGSYVTDDLRERHDDVIWRVKFRGQWFYVYLLIEFQSEIDPWMAVRIMVYVGLLYQDLIKSGAVKTGELLPPVFPLVLYRGASAWNAREEVSELIVPTSRFLAKYHPSLRYFLVDARHTPEESLQNESAASLFVRMERRDDLQDLSLDLARFMQIFSGPKYLSLRRALTVWAKRVLRQRLGENVQIPDVTELAKVIAMPAERLPLFSGKWISEDEARGEARGEAKGRKEGEIKGRVAMLHRLLVKRFGENTIDLSLQDRLMNSSPEQLDGLAEQILDAETIDEVFSDNV